MSTESASTDTVLQRVYHQERKRLVLFAKRIGAAEDAEDVVQDLWLKIINLQKPVELPRAYLYRAVHTTMIDRYRSRRRTVVRDDAWQDFAMDMPGGGVDPIAERRLIARDLLRLASDRIHALGEPTSSIFHRHRINLETQRSIADDLGLGLTTVESHLRRAYRALVELRAEHDA